MILHTEKKNNKHTQMCLALLPIRELQFKIKTECHFLPMRVSKIRRVTRLSVGDVKHLKLIYHWYQCTLIVPLWKTV